MTMSLAQRYGAIGLLLAGAGLSSCGGGGSSGSPAAPIVAVGTPPPPVLVAGATYAYAGSETVAITYASPSATNVNSSGAYTYTANQTVSTAASGSPAQFDVNRVTTYTVTTAPVSGELLLSVNADTYENQAFSGATETLTSPAAKSTTLGVDLSAGTRLGGGPYNESNTSTTTYVTPETFAIYPLQTGLSIIDPLARAVTSVTVDANAGGTPGGGGTTTTTYNNDGSFTRTSNNNANGSQSQQTVNSNGTASQTVTPTTGYPTQTAVGLPTGSGTTIPVTVTTNGVVTNDVANDWYMGGAAPSPLALTTRTVTGPVALSTYCAFVGTPPPVIETTVTSTNLDTLGSYSTTTTENFNANGVNICTLQTATTTNYTITTGALSSTTVTNLTEALVSSNQTITGIKRRATAP